MIYDCCHYHFVSFYSQSQSQSMIEFTVTLHNAVARKHYLTIHSATFTGNIDGFQTDWQLICTYNALMLLKALIVNKMMQNDDDNHKTLFMLLKTFFIYSKGSNIYLLAMLNQLLYFEVWMWCCSFVLLNETERRSHLSLFLSFLLLCVV